MNFLIQGGFKDFFGIVGSYIGDDVPEVNREISNNVRYNNISIVDNGKERKTYTNGLLHSIDDKPAFLSKNKKVWYKFGEIHRDNDQPAEITADPHYEIINILDKYEFYGYLEGEFEMISCPYQAWYHNGNIHRDNDQPAIITKKGAKIWVTNGKIHRDKNPAIIVPKYHDRNGKVETSVWFENGNPHRDDDEPTVDSDLCGMWYKNGKLHREGDFAVIGAESSFQKYYYNGLLHRNDGPAFIDNDIKWYQHGVLHREDGPARLIRSGYIYHTTMSGAVYPILTDCILEWYINGKLIKNLKIKMNIIKS